MKLSLCLLDDWTDRIINFDTIAALINQALSDLQSSSEKVRENASPATRILPIRMWNFLNSVLIDRE